LVLLCLFSLALAKVTFTKGLLGSYEEPKYNILPNPVNGANYEIRQYLSANWTVNTYEAASMDDAADHSFMKLFTYIKGANQLKQEIPMTIPVLKNIGVRSCASCKLPLKMMFYLPSKYQSSPPQPTDDSLQIVELDQTVFYVRVFSGYAKPADWYKEASALHDELKADGITQFDETSFMTAGYNSPFDVFKRRNEIWFKKL